jgi:uncharacterized protein (DUF302 family)
MPTRLLLSLFVAALLAGVALPAPAQDAGLIVRYTKEAKFEDVRDDLVTAITGRGLVVDHTSHIAQMLDRTGADLGTTKKIYGVDQGITFSFCSASASRKTMEADVHNIVFCPYTISVYSTVDAPKKVYVAYRRPQSAGSSAASKAALHEVEMLLDGIAREALNLPAK